MRGAQPITRREPRRQRGPWLRVVAAALIAAGVFVLGVAVGAALAGDPEPRTATYERTLRFVTVTVTSP
jgi:hypothetical protein